MMQVIDAREARRLLPHYEHTRMEELSKVAEHQSKLIEAMAMIISLQEIVLEETPASQPSE